MLKQVLDYSALEEQIRSLMKAGITTNALPDGEDLRKEIAAGTLFVQESEEGLLLLRRRQDFDRLSWIIHRGARVPAFLPERATVLELPYRSGDAAAAAISAQWEDLGFSLAFSRLRLTRKPSPEPCFPVQVAALEQISQVQHILNTCFSPQIACLPDPDALTLALLEGRVLMLAGGILHFQTHGKTSEIRHLAVLPDYRGQKVAHALIRGYLSLQGGGICRVWTAENNGAALHLYDSHGFAADGWRSDVRIFERT